MYLMNMYQKEGIPYLVKEKSLKGFDYCCPDDIVKSMRLELKVDKLPEEHVWLIIMRDKPTSIYEVSKGAMSYAYVDNAAIMTRVLLSGAMCFALIHNHPSGNTTPSNEDDKVTEQLKQVADLMDVNFVDHIIIGKGYYSYAEEGRM